MEQMTGQTRNIVLSVKEGRGFDFVCKHPILVEAGLENNILDANLSPPSSKPQFGMEFLWETTKEAARLLRTAEVSLRLEFYSIIDGQTRSNIGCVVVNLSGAYIVPKEQCSDSYPRTWYKLITSCATAETNDPQPEVLVGLRIEEVPPNKEQQFPQEIIFKPLRQEPEKTRNELQGIDMFSIEIGCSEVYGLDNVLSSDMSGKAHLVYKIFGTSINSLPSPNVTESSKTCITISFMALQFLFQHSQSDPNMKIHLMMENTELAFGEVDVRALLPFDDVDVFLQRHGFDGSQVCANNIKLIPKDDDIDNINRDNDSCYPYVDVVVRLQYSHPMVTAVQREGEKHTEECYCLPVNDGMCRVLQAAGEVYPARECATHLGNLKKNPTSHRKPSSTSHIPSPRFPKSLTSHSEPTLNGPLPKGKCYNSYSLELSVENICLHELLTQEKIFFKFYHPRADIFSMSSGEIFVKEVNKTLCIENTRCTFKFVALVDEISRFLMIWPPNISMCTNLDNQTTQLATVTIDTGRLLVNNKSSSCSLPLIDTPSGGEVGSISIAMSLAEVDPHLGKSNALRHIVSEGGFRPHDDIAYSVVEELHIWKERQEEIFNAELIAKEKRHLDLMATEFKKKRDSLQSRLHRDLLQCQMVIQTLQAALEENRAFNRKQIQMEAELKLRQEELDRRYRRKFQDLREASKRMEDDLHHKMKLVEREQSDLHVVNERLLTENSILRQTIHDQDIDLKMCRKGSLSKEQIASLLQETKSLQEKLKEATESKTLYKQQWAMAVREIHKIKRDHQESIQIQIRDFKEELKSLGYQHVLNDEESDLQLDQQILEQIGADINDGYDDYSQKLNEMFQYPTLKGITLSEATCLQNEICVPSTL